jgi:ubiquinone/menaquinone biosynthesis C-methylase UbiE
MQRRVAPELLDDDLGTPAEVSSSLKDLRHINQWFGGTQTTIALLRQVAEECGCKELSLLEIGSGHGDVPVTAKRALAKRGIALQVTLLDRRWSHLPRDGTASVAGDAMRLPFRDSCVDIVSSSLFAHHFSPESFSTMVNESLRVCRRAVIINDLIRSRLHLLLVYLGLPLFHSRITWNDAPASVRAAYSVQEMRSLVSQLKAGRVAVSRHFLYRMGIIVWK